MLLPTNQSFVDNLGEAANSLFQGDVGGVVSQLGQLADNAGDAVFGLLPSTLQLLLAQGD